jgi:hypothetical protein
VSEQHVQLEIGGEVRDPQLARQLAEAGMDAARRAERVQAWKDAAELWLQLRDAGAEVIADDLVSAIGLPDDSRPARNNVLGAMFSAWAKRGAIVWTREFRSSERAVGHGNLQRVWRVL